MKLIKTYKSKTLLGDTSKLRIYYDKDIGYIGYRKLILIDKSKLDFPFMAYQNIIRESDKYALLEIYDAFKCDTIAMIMNDLIKLKIFEATEI